jgi:hypothetical protein
MSRLFRGINRSEMRLIGAGVKSALLMRCADEVVSLAATSPVKFKVTSRFRDGHGFDYQLSAAVLRGKKTEHTIRLSDLLGKMIDRNHKKMNGFTVTKDASAAAIYDLLKAILLTHRIDGNAFKNRGIEVVLKS